MNPIVLCSFTRYILENKSDDSILLILIIRIMDALGNYGNECSIWISFHILFQILFVYSLSNLFCSLFPKQEVWNMMSGLVTGRLGSWNLLP